MIELALSALLIVLVAGFFVLLRFEDKLAPPTEPEETNA